MASDREGWSGCCFAHSSTRVASARGIRSAVTGSWPVAGRPPRRFCFTFCLTAIWVCVIHFGRPVAKGDTSPPALTQATEVTHGSGSRYYYSNPRADVLWTAGPVHKSDAAGAY